jgi:hypothetical protein
MNYVLTLDAEELDILVAALEEWPTTHPDYSDSWEGDAADRLLDKARRAAQPE